MSASAAEERSNVRSVQEFLKDTLREADKADRAYHAARRRLRLRLYALEIAEDESVAAEVNELAEALATGNPPETFSLDEVREREARR